MEFEQWLDTNWRMLSELKRGGRPLPTELKMPRRVEADAYVRSEVAMNLLNRDYTGTGAGMTFAGIPVVVEG